MSDNWSLREAYAWLRLSRRRRCFLECADTSGECIEKWGPNYITCSGSCTTRLCHNTKSVSGKGKAVWQQSLVNTLRVFAYIHNISVQPCLIYMLIFKCFYVLLFFVFLLYFLRRVWVSLCVHCDGQRVALLPSTRRRCCPMKAVGHRLHVLARYSSIVQWSLFSIYSSFSLFSSFPLFSRIVFPSLKRFLQGARIVPFWLFFQFSVSLLPIPSAEVRSLLSTAHRLRCSLSTEWENLVFRLGRLQLRLHQILRMRPEGAISGKRRRRRHPQHRRGGKRCVVQRVAVALAQVLRWRWAESCPSNRYRSLPKWCVGSNEK